LGLTAAGRRKGWGLSGNQAGCPRGSHKLQDSPLLVGSRGAWAASLQYGQKGQTCLTHLQWGAQRGPRAAAATASSAAAAAAGIAAAAAPPFLHHARQAAAIDCHERHLAAGVAGAAAPGRTCFLRARPPIPGRRSSSRLPAAAAAGGGGAVDLPCTRPRAFPGLGRRRGPVARARQRLDDARAACGGEVQQPAPAKGGGAHRRMS
jgi:hypothetical protein